jgi:hypothetical protein
MSADDDRLDGFLSASPLDDARTLPGRARSNRMLLAVAGVGVVMFGIVVGIAMLIASRHSDVELVPSPRGAMPRQSPVIAARTMPHDPPERRAPELAVPEPADNPTAIAEVAENPVEPPSDSRAIAPKRPKRSSDRAVGYQRRHADPHRQQAAIEPYRNGMPAVHLEGEALRLALIEDAKITQRANAAALSSTLDPPAQ